MKTPELIDETGLKAAADWLVEAQSKGKTLMVDYGVGQIIEAYLNGKQKSVADILKMDHARIKRFREENGCSLLEAKNTIVRHQIADAIPEGVASDDLKLILLKMLELL